MPKGEKEVSFSRLIHTLLFLSNNIQSLSQNSKLKNYQYTNSCTLCSNWIIAKGCNLNVNVPLYRHKRHAEAIVSLSCSETVQLPLKIRCNVHSVKAKSEVNSHTNRSRSFCIYFFYSQVDKKRHLQSCLSLVFTHCRSLNEKSSVG